MDSVSKKMVFKTPVLWKDDICLYSFIVPSYAASDKQNLNVPQNKSSFPFLFFGISNITSLKELNVRKSAFPGKGFKFVSHSVLQIFVFGVV